MATAIISGIFMAATSLSGFWFGSLVDHYPKKRLMIISGCISLLIYIVGLILYLLTPEATWKDPSSVVLWVFIPLLLAGVLAGNIRSIALPTIVTLLFSDEERAKANGLVGTASGIAFLIVSAISGFLVGFAGMTLVLILGIVIMIASIIHLYFIEIPSNVIVQRESEAPKLDIRGTMVLIAAVPGLMALIFFSTLNNFLGGVFMGLMDAYGLSLVSVEVWGVMWAGLSLGFIVGGLYIARKGLGNNPLKSLFLANIVIWAISSVFTVYSSLYIFSIGMFIYMSIVPVIEAAEQTIIQKVVPADRQGWVFGFAQSIETAASPLSTLFIGPLAELVFIPFMTTGMGVQMIGGWFGTGVDRGIALVFTVTGIIGLIVTFIAMRTRNYRILSKKYQST
jgi:DHA3 family multidrug efflux protein-like MFS transporter